MGEPYMRIYLVQHSLALDETEDPSRPVSEEGCLDITRTAGFLSLFDQPKPKLVFHSGKLRAQQTAEMFKEAWGLKTDIDQVDDLSPNADPQVWAAKLKVIKDDLLIVGHLPHLPKLAGLLLCNDADANPITFKNAGVLCLEKVIKDGKTNFTVLYHITPQLFHRAED